MATALSAAAALAAPSCRSRAPQHAGRQAAAPAPRAFCSRPQHAAALAVPARSRPATARRAVSATATTEVGKLISKVEIPAFIPRSDLMEQLIRWALIEVQESGVATVGSPCKVTPFMREDLLWGFTVSFLRDGVSATDVRVAFDEETVLKHDWVGRGADGMPVLEGNAEEILGKHFEIRKVDDKPVNDNLRGSIRDFCQLLVAAINAYYAFGSCFSEDAT